MKKKIFIQFGSIQFGSSFGTQAIITPYIDELLSRGHAIRYIGKFDKEKYDGFDIKPITDGINLSTLDDNDAYSEGYNDWYTIEEFMEHVGSYFGKFNLVVDKVNELEELIRDYAPDLIISCHNIFCSMVARVLNIPLLGIAISCYHPESIYDVVRWWEPSTPTVKVSLKDNINQYFSERNVKKLENFKEIFTGDITVVPGFSKFDPLKGDNEYNTYYTGLVLGDDYLNDSSNENSSRIFEFSNDKAVIFCYTGRFQDNSGITGAKLLDVLVETAKLSEYNFVVATGSQIDADDANKIISQYKLRNIKAIDKVAPFIAHGNSDLVIHHGGHGSCISQFIYKKPAIILATHSEREFNARRMKHLNCAEYLTGDRIDAINIVNSIELILNSDEYFKSIVRLAREASVESQNFDKIMSLCQELW